MANTYFEFKQFTVHQEHCAMKVSTDAVILGALAQQENPANILDIGTGTGVISLMLAQRFSTAHVHAVEIDEPAFAQASQNVSNSPWPDRITLYHRPFQKFTPGACDQFQLIVSNPPYFPQHLQSKDAQRNMALHNDGLPFGELIKGVVKLLDRPGEFWVILPPRQMEDLEKIAGFFGLYPKSIYQLKDRPSTRTLRHIQSFAYGKHPVYKETITIKNEDYTYSEAYQQLLKDFLLIF